MPRAKIAHITTVHSRFDTRILENQCVYLAKIANVTLYVADGMAEEKYADVSIISMFKSRGKVHRLLSSFFRVPLLLCKKDFDVFHFHDPELLPAAYILSIFGRRVVFDVHEDYELDVLQKTWLPLWLRKLSSLIYVKMTLLSFPKFSAILSVTEKIADKLPGDVSVVKNYPRADIFAKTWPNEKFYTFCYVGSISLKRGLANLIKLAAFSNRSMILIGNFATPQDESFFQRNKPENMTYIGFVPPKDTGKFLSQAQVGLHLVDDDKNLLDGIPLKILEYVAHGLHVICSDSEAWRNEFSKIPSCHFTNPADYENIETILENINSEISDTTKQAKKILESEYSWETQFSILTSVYDRILKDV
jgi:glycosyltransferase involved in cell wall biosynthesis